MEDKIDAVLQHLPLTMVFDGEDWISTGKIGTGINDGVYRKEYALVKNGAESRVWMDSDFNVQGDDGSPLEPKK